MISRHNLHRFTDEVAFHRLFNDCGSDFVSRGTVVTRHRSVTALCVSTGILAHQTKIIKRKSDAMASFGFSFGFVVKVQTISD